MNSGEQRPMIVINLQAGRERTRGCLGVATIVIHKTLPYSLPYKIKFDQMSRIFTLAKLQFTHKGRIPIEIYPLVYNRHQQPPIEIFCLTTKWSTRPELKNSQHHPLQVTKQNRKGHDEAKNDYQLIRNMKEKNHTWCQSFFFINSAERPTF